MATAAKGPDAAPTPGPGDPPKAKGVLLPPVVWQGPRISDLYPWTYCHNTGDNPCKLQGEGSGGAVKKGGISAHSPVGKCESHEIPPLVSKDPRGDLQAVGGQAYGNWQAPFK